MHVYNMRCIQLIMSSFGSIDSVGWLCLGPPVGDFVTVCTVFDDHVSDLFQFVWEAKEVPKEWVDAVLVPERLLECLP